MTTLTAIRPLTATRTCTVCNQPSSEDQGLIYEIGGYVHAACSTRNYQLVTAISFPSDDDFDPEPDPTSPAPAVAVVSGPDLCEECRWSHCCEDLCDSCQQAWNEWDSDHAPDWDKLAEKYDWQRYFLIAA